MITSANNYQMMNLENPIRTIMTPVEDLVAVYPDTPFAEIKVIFKRNNFHHIPVINNEGVIVGIISKLDWLRNLKFAAAQSGGRTWSRKYYESLKAKDLMTENPITLEPEEAISVAADILIENKYHAIPVSEDGRLIGILTTHDLITFAYYSH
jgi:CBS domain-containing protein